MERIGFVGAGNMASAIVAGLLASGTFKADRIRCSDVSEQRRALVAAKHGISVSADNAEVIAWAEVVVLSVKPQVLADVLSQCGASFRAGQLVVSVVAGASIGQVRKQIQVPVRLVRAMPNTPALVSEGATAIAPSKEVTEEELSFCQRLFESVGTCRLVPEHLMDAVTGLSGSGPAYVLMAIEAMAEGGVRAGLPRAEALGLAAQTFLGTAKLLIETGAHPAVLKDKVTSPGGTTAAGLHALERGGLRVSLIDAVCAATERAKELGQGG